MPNSFFGIGGLQFNRAIYSCRSSLCLLVCIRYQPFAFISFHIPSIFHSKIWSQMSARWICVLGRAACPGGNGWVSARNTGMNLTILWLVPMLVNHVGSILMAGNWLCGLCSLWLLAMFDMDMLDMNIHGLVLGTSRPGKILQKTFTQILEVAVSWILRSKKACIYI